MGDTMVAPPGPEDQPTDSFFDRALGVFTSPGPTFESIVGRPNFLPALIITIVSALTVTEVMLDKIGVDRIIRASIEASSRGSSMTPEQIEQAVHQAGPITAILARVAGLVAPPIYLLVIAAVGLFIVNTIFGATTNFKVSFSIICYANLVSLVGAVMGLVVILFGDPDQFNARNFIPSNVGFFLNQRETSKALYAIASSFDIFTTWFLAVASIGLSAAAAKKARPIPIFLSYLGMWIIWVLGKAGWAMLMG